MAKVVTRTKQIRRKVLDSGDVAVVERITTSRGSDATKAAGMRNLQHWKERQQSVEAVLRATVDEFEKGFDTGSPPTPTEKILIASAVASYSALVQCVERLKARNSFDRVLKLTARLTSLQRGLLKTIASLDQMRAASSTDLTRPPVGASEEVRRAWSKKYVDSLLEGADRTKPQ